MCQQVGQVEYLGKARILVGVPNVQAVGTKWVQPVSQRKCVVSLTQLLGVVQVTKSYSLRKSVSKHRCRLSMSLTAAVQSVHVCRRRQCCRTFRKISSRHSQYLMRFVKSGGRGMGRGVDSAGRDKTTGKHRQFFTIVSKILCDVRCSLPTAGDSSIGDSAWTVYACAHGRHCKSHYQLDGTRECSEDPQFTYELELSQYFQASFESVEE